MAKNKISVIGIGRLGICLSMILSKCNEVVGYDINSDYIKSINDGKFYSEEPGLNDFIKDNNNFIATDDLVKTLSHSDIILVLVRTDSLSDGSYDSSNVDAVVSEVIKESKINNFSNKILVLCSTVSPGKCDSINDKLKEIGWELVYVPEFAAQGKLIHDFNNPDIFMIGSANKEYADVVEDVFVSSVDSSPKVFRMDFVGAEIAKIASNCFITTKISFANMVGDIAIASKTDPKIILKAIGSDSRIGNKCLSHGFGYGGHCFPRDNAALINYSNLIGVDDMLPRCIDNFNNYHLRFLVDDFIKNHGLEDLVTIYGVSYKPGVNDIHKSQQLDFAVALAKHGYSVRIVDTKSVIEQVEKLHGNLFVYSEHSK